MSRMSELHAEQQAAWELKVEAADEMYDALVAARDWFRSLRPFAVSTDPIEVIEQIDAALRSASIGDH